MMRCIKSAYSYAGSSGSSYANPHAVTSAGTETFAYDKNGNLATTSLKTHTWDYNNRLSIVAITLTSRRIGIYGYDPAGQRVSATSLGVTTHFPTESYSSNGSTTTVSLSVAGLPIATVEKVGTSSPQVYAIHSDHLRSSRLSTDAAGAVVESTDYDPFGKITKQTQTGSFNDFPS